MDDFDRRILAFKNNFGSLKLTWRILYWVCFFLRQIFFHTSLFTPFLVFFTSIFYTNCLNFWCKKSKIFCVKNWSARIREPKILGSWTTLLQLPTGAESISCDQGSCVAICSKGYFPNAGKKRATCKVRKNENSWHGNLATCNTCTGYGSRTILNCKCFIPCIKEFFRPVEFNHIIIIIWLVDLLAISYHLRRWLLIIISEN